MSHRNLHLAEQDKVSQDSDSDPCQLTEAGEVEREKKNTYDKCIPFLKGKFRETFGEREFTVRGLWFGSRETIPKRTRSFLEELGVDIKDAARMAENIVLDSLGIIHHHVHG
ncbi:unnamed protein product [Nezara viridula]|uniref:Uncharacterized protein n=1 Tax=Nezara viridula TaxID=85310 RepID=A0A9P0HNB6_NEZVI|nr:unnamed protein product [Nezara viridula]